MFRNQWRKLDTIIGGENLVKSIDIPRKDLLREILLRFYVNVNVTTLGTPSLYSHAPAKWLKRIEVISDGRDTLKSINMQALVLKNFFNYSTYPRRTVPTLATGDNKFYQTVILPFNLPRAVREIDTLVNTARLSTFVLQATFGSKDSGFSVAPSAYTLANTELEVHIHEAININVPKEKLNFSVYKEMTIEKEVTQTQSEFQILLPVGNVYRGFLIEAEVNGNPADNVINEIQIRSGTTVFYKGKWLSIREMNALKHKMETESFVGYAYIDFCPEGRMADALDASKLSMLEAIFDVTKQTGTNNIRIYPDELIIPSLVRG
mgnify:FL=1